MNYGDGISLIIATLCFAFVFLFFVSYLMLMEIVIFITLFSSLCNRWLETVFHLFAHFQRKLVINNFERLRRTLKFSL